MEMPKTMISAEPTIILTSGASGRVNALLSVRALKSLVRLINVMINVLLVFFQVPFRGRNRCLLVASERVVVAGKEERQEVGGGGISLRKGGSSSCGGGGRSGVGPVVRVPAAISPRRAVADLEVAARRAIAIRRVIADKDEKSVREFSLFATSRGATLFTQSWTPVSLKIRGLVVLLHGLNEHSGRYSDFAKQLNANGFKVYGMDWIGHGGSDGLHGFVPSLDDAVADMKAFLDEVLSQNPSLPCFCFGHSTGAAIILKAVLDPKVEARIQGVVVTSPAVGVQASHPIYAVVAPIVSLLLPRYQCGAANKKGAVVSRDPEALLAKYSDPLVYTGSLRVRTGYEILRISTYLQQNLIRLRVPFLLLHGTADTITDPAASERLYQEASSADKMIKLYPGLLHDLLFEPERQAIREDIIDWLSERTEE
ncbi:hypothetical protein Ancab_029917 [Ancistrocladus abbreviatus]